jgi:hypothetical protein
MGELIGGVTGTILSLRKGDYSALSPEDRAALQVLIWDGKKQGQSADELIAEVETALLNKEAGSLAEIAKSRGLSDIQIGLEHRSPAYARELQAKGEARQQKVAEDIRGQFPGYDPAMDEQSVQATQRALDQQWREAEAATSARQLEAGVPQAEASATEAAQRLSRATEAEAAAIQGRQAAEGSLAPLRAANLESSIPTADRDIVFEGVNRNNPEEVAAAEQAFWAPEAGMDGKSPGAFTEVKLYDGEFPLGEGFISKLRGVLDTADVRATMKQYVGDAMNRIAAVRKIEIPNMKAEDFDPDAFEASLEAGTLKPAEIMALRNYFAIQANDATNGVDKITNREIANALDQAIVDELPPEAAAKFTETKKLYPTHLTNKKVMGTPKNKMAFGEFDPFDYATAGKDYGYPNLEPTRQAQRSIDQAKAAEKLAAAETKAAQAQVNAATRAVKNAQKAAGTDTPRLARARYNDFATDPVATLRKLITSSNISKSVEDLSELRRIMYEDGSDVAFDAMIGQALFDSLNSRAAGTGVKFGDTTFKKGTDYLRRLRKSGAITDENAEAIGQALEDQATSTFLKGGLGAKTQEGDSLNAYENLAASVGAAVALKSLAPSSSSLILANSVRRALAWAIKGKTKGKALESMREMTANPQRFAEIANIAKDERDLQRLFLTELVGAAQANKILSEEEQ